MGGSTPTELGTIAQRLDELISSRGRPSSYEEIARASREYARVHGGPTISHQGVLNIRSGKVTNPGVDSLRALANVYGVDITYFFHRPSPLPAPEPAPTATPARSSQHPADNARRKAPLPPPATLATSLNRLFNVVLPSNRLPLSDQDVAEAVSARGVVTTAAQIAALRAGVRDNAPDDRLTRARLVRLSDVFGVPCAYFFDEQVAARVSDDLAILQAFKDVGTRRIALRAVADLDEEALSALVPVIEHLGRASRQQQR